MNRSAPLALAVTLLGVGCATDPPAAKTAQLRPSAAREELDALADRKLELLREAGRAALQPLRLYPEDVRHAMLEISRDPALIVRTLDAAGDPNRLAKRISDYPPEMQQAARTLAPEREVLRILEDNLIVAGVLGAMYDDDPERIRHLLTARAREVEAREAQVVDDWKQRLEDDPEAMRQMQEATEAYQSQGGAASATGTTTVSGATVVYSAPSYSYTVYVMNNCSLYYSLCGGMYSHSAYWGSYYDDLWDDYWDDYWEHRDAAREDWQNHLEESREDRQESRDERRGDDPEARREQAREAMDQAGNGGMRQAVDDWKERNADVLPADLSKSEGKLSERMRSFGERERTFRDGYRRGEYTRRDRQRAMGERSAQASRGVPGTAAVPRTPGARGKDARVRPRSELPSRVERRQMPRTQRIDRARGAHRSSWGSRSLGGYGARRGGMRGGGRVGGRR